MVHPYINQMLETSLNHAPMTYSACNKQYLYPDRTPSAFLLEPKTLSLQAANDCQTPLLKPSEHQPL